MNCDILKNAFYHLEPNGEFVKGDAVEDCYRLKVHDDGKVEKIHSAYNTYSMEYMNTQSLLTKEEILGLAVAKDVIAESPMERLKALGYHLVTEEKYPMWARDDLKSEKAILLVNDTGVYLLVPGSDHVCNYIRKRRSSCFAPCECLTIQEIGALGAYIMHSGMPYQTHRQYI